MPWVNFNNSKRNKMSGGYIENCTELAKEISKFCVQYFDVISLEDKKELLNMGNILLKAKKCLVKSEKYNMSQKFAAIKSKYVR